MISFLAGFRPRFTIGFSKRSIEAYKGISREGHREATDAYYKSQERMSECQVTGMGLIAKADSGSS